MFRYILGFWFLVCYAATQLATQLQQRYIQVVRSNDIRREEKKGNAMEARTFFATKISSHTLKKRHKVEA